VQDTAAYAASTHKISNRQYEQLLRQNFINVRRVREWRDIHTQLRAVAGEQHWQQNAKAAKATDKAVAAQAASYEALHKSLLAGLLGNVGCKIEAEAGD
jgi:ATP-dependent helicase HrpA